MKLIGRVVGGKEQGDLPLDNSLSRNNLGNDLQMVLTLEGDNTSRLIWDIQDRNKKERDTVFYHNAHDKMFTYQTKVHTTLNRMVVKPDLHTGEYVVYLPPVKWKIQQITAQGYATLFQDGKTGDVIDLTDSIIPHTDHYDGKWTTADKKEVKSVDVKYHAIYNRIYHSPVLIEYKQQGYDTFNYFGDRYYTAKELTGDKEKVSLVYQKFKEEYLKDKAAWGNRADSVEVKYSFGHPVFNIDNSYLLQLSAVEKFYYNNNTKSDTIDVVKLSGGKVTIQNGLVSSTHRDTVRLNEVGEGTYILKAKQVPYLLSGEDALRTVTMTLELDSTFYEATPLRAYLLNIRTIAGAQQILPVGKPQLIDILRDPPGGGSSAKLSKGSTLKYSCTQDFSLKGGLKIGLQWGAESSWYAGMVALTAETGFINGAKSKVAINLDLVVDYDCKDVYSYTITTTEDISTSSGTTMVGADADVYIGMEQNIVLKPATAIRAIPHSMWLNQQGLVASGRSLEIAQGVNEKGELVHLVRDEVLTYAPQISSTFVHSQQYITKQLMPELEEQCKSLLFTGSAEDALRQANATGKPVYLSLISPDDPHFGLYNNNDKGEPLYYTNKMNSKPAGDIYYQIVLPDDWKGGREDHIADHGLAYTWWAEIIAQNEKEKLSVTESNLVRNFEVDGGAGMTYSEDFSSEISSTSYCRLPWGNMISAPIAGLAGALLKILSKAVSSASGGSADHRNADITSADVHLGVTGFKIDLTPVFTLDNQGTFSDVTKYNRKESFTISMDKKSHLSFDLYRVETSSDNVKAVDGFDVISDKNYENYVQKVYDGIVKNRFVDYYKDRKWKYARGFVYRTRAGSTCRPWEDERRSQYYDKTQVIDVRTKKIENPVLKMDKQSISGVPFDEPARFKLYMTNESEAPEAIAGALRFYTLYLASKSNPKGARLLVDGMPLTQDGVTIMALPGEITEKTLEVWASEDYDYENLRIGLISQGDVQCVDEAQFSVHFLQTAGSVAISTPGDKWIMNTDAPYDAIKGWYMPVVISGFNKTQHNFDHIELQYKENTRGDDYWTNLCGFYADSTLYRAASGTKEMIPENGNIITRFFGEGVVMEKAYDLRAVLFCRNGNGFLTNSSKVLSGVKDTRRPQLFGTPEPKDGVLGAGENIVFNFSEDIEYNYLQATTNFIVKGETNETTIQEEPSLQFDGKGYAQSEANRNFADKDLTIEVMIKPDNTNIDMPIFSHGRDGKQLQLWLTKDKRLRAVVDDNVLETKKAMSFLGFKRVALAIDNQMQRLILFGEEEVDTLENVTYSGYGPIIFGSTNQADTSKRKYYKGRMLQGRIWNRAMDKIMLNTYGNQLLTGYEMGLTDYYPMNEGQGNYAADGALGAHLTLYGASWALPRGMSLHFDKKEQREIKGLELKSDYIDRSSEQDYTLMFWFKTNSEGRGTLIANGSGRKTDDDAPSKFFIGFEGETLKYRSNGHEYELGKTFSDGSWHHYAMTVNRSFQVASIYVDNDLKAQFSTDSLGGMSGKTYLGNMVWKDAGLYNDVVHQQNPLTGYIDGLTLFEQALPPALIKRYTVKSLGGQEKGLVTFLGFNRQKIQKNGELTMQPFALNQKVKLDADGKPSEKFDSVFADPVADIERRIDRETGAPMQAFEELRNLNFSFVGRDHQLLVNIDELDSRINKRTVYVTVSDIPDLNGNFMKSPHTVAVFVDRNPLRWSQKTYKTTMPYDREYDFEFYVNVINDSGTSHTYTLENLPKWLTANITSDIIEAKSEQIITFRINKDTNVGFYDDIIYLTDENGLSEPLVLNITVEGKQPEWMVDAGMKKFSMNIVGRVQIGDDIVTDSRDIVGVFDQFDRCLGCSHVNYESASAEALAYITVCDSLAAERELYFKLWHYPTGKTMVLTPSEAVSFKPNGMVGTPKEPLILKATTLYEQTVDLVQGWNWVSFNVDSRMFQNVTNLLLYNYLDSEGDIISDVTNKQAWIYRNSEWLSNNGEGPDNLELSTALSYHVRVGHDTQVLVTGESLKQPISRTISVHNGWNCIGYTPMVNLPVTTALADYLDQAKEGDVVKSLTEFAMFTDGANGKREWKGNLKYMKPGEGYMLYRQKPEEVTFKYPYYEPNATFFEDAGRNRAPAAHAFAMNMTMVAEAEGIDLQEGDRLLAYAGGEVRGETEVQPDADATDTAAPLFLTIAGDQQTPLSFAIERDGEIIAVSSEQMDFRNDAVIGTLKLPTRISFRPSEQLPQDGWYNLQGIKLDKRPLQRGVYIFNGKKTIIK